ncbi:MAG: hypothetical protein K2K21_11525 [Lachnospiraceae bacterium]|nr:hypothetical protein [Lachnospiraceae bacterium]
MNKTQIIKKIVGEKLKDYGFSFLKTSGPCRIFIRKVQGVKRYYDPENQVVEQYINIQESCHSQGLTVRFCTDVYGYEMDKSLEELRKYGTGTWITYLDEDSYKERLNTLVEMTIEYGLDFLETMSHEDEIIPTKAMSEKLFTNPKQLSQDFIEEYQIKAEPERLEEIDEWFHIIKKLMIDSAELPYEEVKELLTKIAAFIGEKSCEICSYKWLFPEHFKTPEIIGKPYNLVPLKVVVNAWKYKCDEQHWKFIERQWKILKKGLAEKKNLVLYEDIKIDLY